MAFFQTPASTPEELHAGRPLERSPAEVQEMTEEQWYAEAFRGDSPQLTLRAVLMGTALGFLLSFTNIYVGLKTGWLLGVALTACILSYTIWNAFMALGFAKTPMSILENNCMQSTASAAGYSTGNTLISAVPAVLLLSVSPENPGGTQMRWYILAGWVFCLAVLGTSLAIPLKRSLINRERLKFPSGTAAAVTLQGLYAQGEQSAKRARALFVAMVSAMVLPLIRDLHVFGQGKDKHALIPGDSRLFDFLGSWFPNAAAFHPSGVRADQHVARSAHDWNLNFVHEGVLIAAGALTGLRTSVWMMVGAYCLMFWLGPYALDAAFVNSAGVTVYAVSSPHKAWKEIGIWLGAPILVSSSLVAFAAQGKTMVRAAKQILGGRVEPTAHDLRTKEVEVPVSWFGAGAAVSGIGVIIITWCFFDIPPHLGLLAVLMTLVLGVVACRATGETDITPGSAMGKIMQLTYGVLLPQSSTANLMTAGITSGAGLAAADLLTDLKSGYLLGAHPRRQFLAQAFGILTGTLASVLCYFILVPNAQALESTFPAPSAQAWKAVAQVFKSGIENLHPLARTLIPWGLAIGAVLGVLELLFPKAKKWLPSANGLGFGFILPFSNPVSFFIGALLAWGAEAKNKKWMEDYVVPIAAGAIAGESIMGVIVTALSNFVLK